MNSDVDSRAAGPATLRLDEIASLVKGRLVGDGSLTVTGVAPVDEAEPDQMAFLSSSRYTRYVGESRAGACLVSGDLEEHLPAAMPRVVVDDPYPALRTLLGRFHPARPVAAGVHPTAVLGAHVRLGDGVSIGPYVVIEDDAEIGDGCRIDSHCVVGRACRVGAGSHLYPHVVLYSDTIVGSNVIVHSGTRLGADGFGFTFVDGAHRKMPQVGRCVVGDDVEIGANATIDRGSLGDTVIGHGVKLDNLVHIAHNVRVGAFTLLAALVGISGSTRVGEGVWMGGQVGVSNHLRIGNGARLAIASKLMKDVPDGETMSGHPARRHRDQLRDQAHARRLPRLVERVRRLEEGLRRLTGTSPTDGDGFGAP